MKLLLPALLLASLAGLPAAGAADLDINQPPASKAVPRPSPEPGWIVQVSPYLWASGIRGDIAPFRRAPTISIEKSFSDVLDELNVGGFVNIWGRYDRFVVSADIMYVDTTDARSVGALPRLGPTPGLGAGVDSTQFAATLEAGYRVYDTPAATLDLMAGLRWWELSNTATIQYADYAIAYGESFGWVDPIIGARGFVRLSDKLSAMVQGDIGGFDAASRFTWQVLATVNYAFTDSLSASLGYKALAVDYRSDGHVFDSTLSGPVLGMTYRF